MIIKPLLKFASNYTDDVTKAIANSGDDIAKYVKACGKKSVLETKKIDPAYFKGLHLPQKPACDTVQFSSKAGKVVETASKYSYIDDGIYAYEVNPAGSVLRNEIRERILSQAGLNDKNFMLKKMDNIGNRTPQLIENSKYYELGVAKLNQKNKEYVYICENLKDMPDMNGLRGKTPLSSKGKGLKYRLNKIKESGVKTVIDLRSKGECSPNAKQVLKDLEMNYVNFPIEDCQWPLSSLDDITKYLQTVRKGDFYVGCANGQARTDMAVSINYLLNPEAKSLPELYYGTMNSSRISIKDNFNEILKAVKEKPDIVKDWGWKDYTEFEKEVAVRLQKLVSSLSSC